MIIIIRQSQDQTPLGVTYCNGNVSRVSIAAALWILELVTHSAFTSLYTHTDMNYRLMEYNTFIQVNHRGTFITQFTSKALL